MKTPRALGYRLPAEWEPQRGVWLSWPTNRSTWTDCWDRVQHTFAEMALKFSRNESVFINLIQSEQAGAKNALSAVEKETGLIRGDIQFFDHPNDDSWVRDHGPVYIKHAVTGEVALTNWKFNAWGGKYPFARDDQIPDLIQKATGLTGFLQPIILEGGSLETNGVGDLLVTTDCLLNPNRNPGLGKAAIERILIDALGVDKVQWLDGCIEGDDTDGHIDNLVRFFKPDGVLVAAQSNSKDPNYAPLCKLNQQCRTLILNDGRPVEVVPLPLPDPVYYDGRRLPMSYLNFFIGNPAVFVPVYGQRGPDARAMEIIGRTFPDREIVPIDCRYIIREGGALHCLTQQVPQ